VPEIDRVEPQRKPRVHGQVVKFLAQRILEGHFPAGVVLPPEAQFCDQMGVSRGALREAVRVLSGKGLVYSRPRVGTVVRPSEDWHLLDPDLLLWSMELAPNAEFVLSLVEARQVIEPAAARLAALRATVADLAQIDASFQRMSEAMRARDFVSFNAADIAFHTALLRASHNTVFQHLSTTIDAALAYSFRLSVERSRDPGSSLANHGEVIERIRARDTEGAYAAMSRLLNIAVIDLGLSNSQNNPLPR
jgi:GntR family transcriptional regulator, galactonate operon transcriptional repressor